MQFCCLNQRSETGPTKCSLIVARKQAILFCHRNQAICPLDTVGVHLDAAVVQEAYQATPALETVADGLGNGALLRHGGELDFQPGLQAFDARPGFRLPRGATLLGALPTDAVLDGIEFRDALERLARDRRRAASMDVEEQSAPMRPAKSQRDLAVRELPPRQLLIDGVTIALHDAGIVVKQSQPVLAVRSKNRKDSRKRASPGSWGSLAGCPQLLLRRSGSCSLRPGEGGFIEWTRIRRVGPGNFTLSRSQV